jgi:hypothetical protein
MFSYALSTPIRKGTWTPPIPVDTPVEPHSSEKNQIHRFMTWLIGKPENYGIFPIKAKSGRRNE